MSAPYDATLGIPPGVRLAWRIVAFAEGLIFLGLLFLAISLQPVWLGATVFVIGLFASAGCWILLLRILRRKVLRARKVPK
jgi:hypothetical protein